MRTSRVTLWAVLNLFLALSGAETEDRNSTTADIQVNDGIYGCRKSFSIACMKLEFARIVPYLSTARKITIFPGLTLESGGFHEKFPQERSDGTKSETMIDRYLIKGLGAFVNSLSLRVKIMDRDVTQAVRGIEEFVPIDKTDANSPRDFQGRRKRNQMLMMGGVVMAATLLAMTLSAISAMSGKAMMLAMLSMMMSLMGSRGQGHAEHSHAFSVPNGKVSYEIIHSVQPHHDDYFARWPTNPVADASTNFMNQPLLQNSPIQR